VLPFRCRCHFLFFRHAFSSLLFYADSWVEKRINNIDEQLCYNKQGCCKDGGSDNHGIVTVIDRGYRIETKTWNTKHFLNNERTCKDTRYLSSQNGDTWQKGILQNVILEDM